MWVGPYPITPFCFFGLWRDSFLINNYYYVREQFLARNLKCDDSDHFESLLSQQKDQFVEEELAESFGRLVKFVPESEAQLGIQGSNQDEEDEDENAEEGVEKTKPHSKEEMEAAVERVDKAQIGALVRHFASSWKASTQRTSPKDKREDFVPWSNIKPKSGNQRIEPRFTVPQFNYKKQPTVYIGNATEYAAYALESPKVANFIQGEMRSLVQQTFKEKKGGRLFAATGGTDPSQGVGIFKGRTSVSYERI